MPSRSTSGVSLLRRQVQTLDTNIGKLKRQREKTLMSFQARCKHPVDEIVEVAYRDGYFGCMPPFRVCKKCGLAEQGWGCGYWKLETREEVATISEDKARSQYVLKFYSQDDMNKLRFRR